jgi:hypothetical protein
MVSRQVLNYAIPGFFQVAAIIKKCGTVRNGTYVAHLITGGRKIEEKILIAR